MSSLNKATIIGYLGGNAEMRYTGSGTPVANFSMATSDKWTDKDGNKHEDVQWHNVVLWGKTAESLAQFLVKGKQIYVEGRLQTRKWKDKKDIDRYTTEIVAERVLLLGKASDAEPRTERDQYADHRPAKAEKAETVPPSDEDDDSIPF